MSAAEIDLTSVLMRATDAHTTGRLIAGLKAVVREEVQREDAATVRAQAPKYLDTAEDIAAFLVLDKAAALIEPDKEAGQ